MEDFDPSLYEEVRPPIDNFNRMNRYRPDNDFDKITHYGYDKDHYTPSTNSLVYKDTTGSNLNYYTEQSTDTIEHLTPKELVLDFLFNIVLIVLTFIMPIILMYIKEILGKIFKVSNKYPVIIQNMLRALGNLFTLTIGKLLRIIIKTRYNINVREKESTKIIRKGIKDIQEEEEKEKTKDECTTV